jgi:hypothetical protein
MGRQARSSDRLAQQRHLSVFSCAPGSQKLFIFACTCCFTLCSSFLIFAPCFPMTSLSLQLYLNFKRRSVEGLSVGMFTMAIMGNLSYGISLLLRPLSMDYFVSRLPWLVLLYPFPSHFSTLSRLFFHAFFSKSLLSNRFERHFSAGWKLVRVLLRRVHLAPVLQVRRGKASTQRLNLEYKNISFSSSSA